VTPSPSEAVVLFTSPTISPPIPIVPLSLAIHPRHDYSLAGGQPHNV
jgi:hypothetical protein